MTPILNSIDIDQLSRWGRSAAPACDFWSLRALSETSETISVRQGIAQAPSRHTDAGLMVTVSAGGGYAYAACSDISQHGVEQAFADALDLASAAAGKMCFDVGAIVMPAPKGGYLTDSREPFPASLKDRISLVADAAQSIKADDRIKDWQASATISQVEQAYVTGDGGEALQCFEFVVPNLSAVAQHGGHTQTRTSAGQYNGFCQQGGFEVLERSGFIGDGSRIAQEAIELTMAPNCPDGVLDVLLMPDQMMLQIHESIGHPLELDRILGDERNFAGTSFVTLDMFGRYQYGSELLNVTYDPDIGEQFASFAFDDDGSIASRQFVIRDGVLQQPLGGHISQARAAEAGYQFETVATSRACSWNRAPIDRMSNLNVEPGKSSLEQMIQSIESGVLMRTNCSWSIDDSRNKFQFGCEYGQLIKGGKIVGVVRNPNYRGVSADFWRSLKSVGDKSTFEVMGTPFCGKGEPMQVVRVGHASPACLFGDVAVFGAER